ncbi:MAG: nucleotidyltransferase family protein [Planctomycetia bacterium]|nr:nucleotidyltransferase family protein [Planctomycetia bacterium]
MSVLLHLDRLYQFTTPERLALEALLLADKPAALAFRQWLECVDIDGIASASSRLVPALFARHAQGDPLLPHYACMKGVYRFIHVRNSLVIAAARTAVAGLQAAGIEVLVFKGLSLALRYYGRSALRPMMDVDILVSPGDFPRANAILQDQGWRHRYPEAQRALNDHSFDYVNATGQAIDLHSRPLIEVPQGAFDEGLFARARPIDWQGMTVLTPCVEDEVLIGCVNAVRELGAVRLEWVCDLARVLVATPTFDWGQLWDRALVCGVATQVFHALQIAGDVRGLEPVHDQLAALIAGSPAFERDTLREAVDEGRTFGIPEAMRETVNRLIAPAHQTAGDMAARRDWWSEAADAPGSLGTFRVLETERRGIKAIHLRWRHLPLVPSLFHVVDAARWAETCLERPTQGEGILDMQPGLIEHVEGWLPAEAYRATIDIESVLPGRLRAGERLSISTRVTNTSSHPWPCLWIRPALLGLSWHVHLPDGSVVEWDMTRTYFAFPLRREKNVTFLAPGATISCELAFTAPTEPGDYAIRFEVVHETVAWFATLTRPEPEWQLTIRT